MANLSILGSIQQWGKGLESAKPQNRQRQHIQQRAYSNVPKVMLRGFIPFMYKIPNN